MDLNDYNKQNFLSNIKGLFFYVEGNQKLNRKEEENFKHS